MKIILNEKSFSSFLNNFINESNINPIKNNINVVNELLESRAYFARYYTKLY